MVKGSNSTQVGGWAGADPPCQLSVAAETTVPGNCVGPEPPRPPSLGNAWGPNPGARPSEPGDAQTRRPGWCARGRSSGR